MTDTRLVAKRVLIVKEETTAGVDSVPTSANCVYAESLNVKKLNVKTIDRKQIKPFMGSDAKVVASYDAQIDFDIALAIGGTADGVPSPGTTPAYDAILRGCGMAKIVSASAVSGTAQGGTLNTIQLASGASSTDDAYSGLSILATIASGTAQAPGSSALNIIKLAAGASATDDDYNGLLLRVEFFGSSIVSAGQTVSTKQKVYLPEGVSGNVQGCDIEITTGSVVEKRRITNYHTGTRLATLSSLVSVLPTSSSTFIVLQSKKVLDYDGTTKIATLAGSLKFVTAATTHYAITDHRLVIGYDGASKIATVTPPFETAPTSSATYTINPYVKYYPVSTGHISNTIYYYEDGALHSFTYARGKVSFEVSSGALLMAKFSYMGLVERYEDAAFPTYDLSPWVDPLPVNYANTKSLIINGYAETVMDKISLDLGNELVHLDCPGTDMIFIKDRAAKGSVTIWSPLQSEIDFYAAVKDATARTLAFTHGPIGNQISFFCKNVQLLNPSDSEKDGIQMLTLELNIMPYGTGNNEIAMILQ